MRNYLSCFFLLLSFSSKAQLNRYLIQLKDKATTTFSLSSPANYLSQRAIDRRIRYNIAIDSSDLPVPADYINAIQSSWYYKTLPQSILKITHEMKTM